MVIEGCDLPVFVKICEEHELHFPIITSLPPKYTVGVDPETIARQGYFLC